MRFKDLKTKNEYIDYCLENIDDIANINTIIPKEAYMACKTYGICVSNLVTIHYVNGTISVENIIAKAAIACRTNNE